MSFISSPGVVGFSNLQNSAAPNNVIPVSYFLGLGSAASIDVAMQPKGVNGSFLAAIPDNTAAGGNKRGSRAVDLQLSRTLATQIAGGSNSAMVGGSGNTVSGANSGTYAGSGLTVSGNSAFLTGANSTLSGTNSFGAGRGVNDFGLQGALCFAPTFQNVAGDTQWQKYVALGNTSGAGLSYMNSSGGVNVPAPSAGQNYALPNASIITFSGTVTAHSNGGDDYAAFNVTAAFKRGANAASTALVGPATTTLIGTSAGFAAIVAGNVNVVADTAVLGGFAITVAGIAATPIKWVCVGDIAINKY